MADFTYTKEGPAAHVETGKTRDFTIITPGDAPATLLEDLGILGVKEFWLAMDEAGYASLIDGQAGAGAHVRVIGY